MNLDLTPEEQKIVFHSVRYWQTHKASLNGNDYQICDSILNRLFADVKLSTQENTND